MSEIIAVGLITAGAALAGSALSLFASWRFEIRRHRFEESERSARHEFEERQRFIEWKRGTYAAFASKAARALQEAQDDGTVDVKVLRAAVYEYQRLVMIAPPAVIFAAEEVMRTYERSRMAAGDEVPDLDAVQVVREFHRIAREDICGPAAAVDESGGVS